MSSFTNFIGGDNKRMRNNYQDVRESQCKLENFYISQKLIGILGDELNDHSFRSVKRCFSSMVAIHTNIRNKLKPEKVEKLGFSSYFLKKDYRVIFGFLFKKIYK